MLNTNNQFDSIFLVEKIAVILIGLNSDLPQISDIIVIVCIVRNKMHDIP